MGCKCHRLEALLEQGNNVVVKCGNCRLAMPKEVFIDLAKE
jgi:hypothetical protein